MARKYEFVTGRFAYSLEPCEEKLLTAYYLDVENRIRPQAVWKADFIARYFTGGEGVSTDNIKFINAERRRCGVAEIEIRETQASDYPRSPDRTAKAKNRQDFRDEYVLMTVMQRVKLVADLLIECDAQFSPHFTYDERVTLRDEPALGGLSQREVAIRSGAVREMVTIEAMAEPNEPVPDRADKMIRLLKMAHKPETKDRIISKLTSGEAMEVAESGAFTDPDLLDELVNRVLDEV